MRIRNHKSLFQSHYNYYISIILRANTMCQMLKKFSKYANHMISIRKNNIIKAELLLFHCQSHKYYFSGSMFIHQFSKQILRASILYQAMYKLLLLKSD